MKMNFTNQHLLMFALLFICSGLWAQQLTPIDIANRHLQENYKQWNLTAEDISDVVVSDQYLTKHNGVTHLYFLQRYQGVAIYNSYLNIAVSKDGKAFMTGNRFLNDIASRVNVTNPALSAGDAIEKAANFLGIEMTESPRIKEQKSSHEFLFSKGSISNSDIHVKLRYQLMKDGTLNLSWSLAIDQTDNADYWSMRIDAQTGEMLNKNNYTVYCQFEKNENHAHNASCSNHAVQDIKESILKESKILGDGATYRVFALPAESPSHGPHVIAEDPSDAIASPYGWHDVNGIDGAEFTITRGNNVHAYLDEQDTNVSSGDEPDGGADLIFDYPYDPLLEPSLQKEAAVTNLFYMNNMIHDITYHFGFDEVAGNFQTNNYGNGGLGGDFVQAQAQDGGGTNNANFATPGDGSNPRMQMYLWDAGGGNELLTVDAPSSVVGSYVTATAGFGAAVDTIPVSGEVVIVNDGVDDPYATDGCEDILNGDELDGRIALIDRGGCEFGLKALSAEDEGAIAVIICNFADDPVGMGAGAVGNQVTIPVIMIGNPDCQLIRQFAGNGLEVSIVAPNTAGPTQYDGDFDNGIIAHEYGHGISNRLTAGPSATGCLGNGEQMGEGWSDFMTLITSVKAGDTGEMRRGIGTYAQGQPTNGGGIRPFPYSTDLNTNPHTYADAASVSVPHGVGAVWCVMLWDMYWALVDEYGWSDDITDVTAGNNIAVQLVMDGMKLQPCSPGFVDGRDAILLADELNNDGVNQCLIWEVFARRGLGYGADQGSNDTAADGTESYEPHPFCIPELKITKEQTELINAGDEIEVTVRVIHHKPDPVTGVVVTDELPNGLTYIAGSGSIDPTINGNVLTFDIGDMEYDVEEVITYRLQSDPLIFSQQQFFDDVPDDLAEDNWIVDFTGNAPPVIWEIQDLFAYTGSWSWTIEDVDVETRQLLQLAEPWEVTGTRPVLRFWHNYDTQAGVDGGLVDISVDGGMTWQILDDEMIKNGYPYGIDYGTFVVPNLSAFSGNSGGWIPTYVDLSDYLGQEILFRFRFGTNENTAGLGWFIDDIEVMDLRTYNSEVCATSDQADEVCAIAPDGGTIVDSQLGPNATTDALADVEVAIYPNPVNDLLTVALSSEDQKDLNVSITTLEGKEIMVKEVNLFGQASLQMNVSHLPGGFYLVKIFSKDGMLVKKVTIQ
jgi:uncharacterized repeat protein (TIGR01451 family)